MHYLMCRLATISVVHGQGGVNQFSFLGGTPCRRTECSLDSGELYSLARFHLHVVRVSICMQRAEEGWSHSPQMRNDSLDKHKALWMLIICNAD